MVERICSVCQHGNAVHDRFCGKCGTPLERQLPARRANAPLVIAGRQLPVTWGQFGRTVAVSVAALAAEAGLAWLRRRVEQPTLRAAQPSRPTANEAAPAETTALARRSNGVTIFSQRVIDIWDGGEGHRRIVEQTYWRRTEE